MRRAAKVDRNQPAIVAALRKSGCRVLSMAKLGEGAPDLLVGRAGWLAMLEIKNPDKTVRAGLTDDQVRFHAEWHGYPLFVVWTPEEALRAVGL